MEEGRLASDGRLLSADQTRPVVSVGMRVCRHQRPEPSPASSRRAPPCTGSGRVRACVRANKQPGSKTTRQWLWPFCNPELTGHVHFLHSPRGQCVLGSEHQSRENWPVSDLSTYIPGWRETCLGCPCPCPGARSREPQTPRLLSPFPVTVLSFRPDFPVCYSVTFDEQFELLQVFAPETELKLISRNN